MTGSEIQGGAVPEGGMSGAEEIPALPFPSCFEHPAGNGLGGILIWISYGVEAGCIDTFQRRMAHC